MTWSRVRASFPRPATSRSSPLLFLLLVFESTQELPSTPCPTWPPSSPVTQSRSTRRQTPSRGSASPSPSASPSLPSFSPRSPAHTLADTAIDATDAINSTRSVHSRTINNLASARISVPPLIRPADRHAAGPPGGESEEGPYVWRVALEETEPYWRGASCFSLSALLFGAWLMSEGATRLVHGPEPEVPRVQDGEAAPPRWDGPARQGAPHRADAGCVRRARLVLPPSRPATPR